MGKIEQTEIVIIGAGPSGAVAAGLLRKQGRQVLVIEKETFPRFSIGESLLPQSMQYIEEAGMLQEVVEAGFQHKNGAAFAKGALWSDFDFRDKFSPGWGTTYQVPRGQFDKLLADAAEKAGAEIRYGHAVTAVDVDAERPLVQVRGEGGENYAVSARYLLDASGFARILPRLLGLERPSDFPVRGALFTHIEDRIALTDMDRHKILITVHPQHHGVWFWTIPFSDGRSSQGVVATPDYLARYPGTEVERLRAIIAEVPTLAKVLRQAVWDTPGRSLTGYAANVTSLWGKNYALLGNAGEFLDPVFSSGVTIAMKSASLAAGCIGRAYQGETVDWQADYALPLQAGVDTFRAFVAGWYEGGFQDVIFHDQHAPEIRRMIASILAGYAWDRSNPYVAEPQRRLDVLRQLCQQTVPEVVA
ncbi:MAG: NAD(P)/FAD-dependent oxidoreductase [Comamonas sp.]|jgi:flavin-dependent dehydrogenase|nr:NAD(P)/FAD-dependent oxidoreductase [Comamonas sp.]